jgi:DNA repair exonuclease SbcCD ATPase subunit
MDKKASYVMGLIKGLELEPDSKVTKAILALAEFSKSAAEEIEELRERYENLEETLDEIQEEIEEFYNHCDCENENDDDDDEGDDEMLCHDCGEKDSNDLNTDDSNCPKCGDSSDSCGKNCSDD